MFCSLYCGGKGNECLIRLLYFEQENPSIFFNFRHVNDTDRDPSNVTDVALVQCIDQHLLNLWRQLVSTESTANAGYWTRGPATSCYTILPLSTLHFVSQKLVTSTGHCDKQLLQNIPNLNMANIA
jgi:hypothetical protein